MKQFLGGIALVFLCLLSWLPVQAATESEAPVASVNIMQARILSQDEGRFVVSFELGNRLGVQGGVRVAVSLLEKTDGQTLVRNTQVSPTVYSLGTGEARTGEVTYVAPKFLSGTYELALEARNEYGSL